MSSVPPMAKGESNENERNAGGDPEDGRGRQADTPWQLGKAGWIDTLKRVKQEISDDNLSIVSAGVAFYAFLALVPALSAMVSLYGLLADTAQVTEQIESLARVLPPSAHELIAEQMKRVTEGSGTALGWGFALSLLITLWSAKKGMQAVVTATNIAYDEDETRNFFQMAGLTLGLTAGAIVMTILMVGIIVALPVALHYVGLGATAETIITILRWPLIAAVVAGALFILYRLSPDRRDAKWRWVAPGALLATIGWLGASAAFSFYVSNFGSYNETYGALGAVVVLMMWFYLSAFVVLLGAELNSEAEHQTKKDSTVSPEKPMGERGARPADTLGKSP